MSIQKSQDLLAPVSCLISDSCRYFVLWNFVAFFQLHPLTVPIKFTFYALVTKVFGWLLNTLLNLRGGTSVSLRVYLFVKIFFFKSPVVSSTTKKLQKKKYRGLVGEMKILLFVTLFNDFTFCIPMLT